MTPTRWVLLAAGVVNLLMAASFTILTVVAWRAAFDSAEGYELLMARVVEVYAAATWASGLATTFIALRMETSR